MANRVRITVGIVSAGLIGVLLIRLVGRWPRHEAAPATVEAARPPRAVISVVNPVMRWMLASPGRMGRAGDGYFLLHVTGRRSGRTYDIPLSYTRAPDGRLVVVTDAVWRLNLRERPEVEVTLLGVRRPARAQLVEDPDSVAETFAELIDPEAPRSTARRLGLRLREDRVPARGELAEVARGERLCVVHLEVEEAISLGA